MSALLAKPPTFSATPLVNSADFSAAITTNHMSPIPKILINNQGRKFANHDQGLISLPASVQVSDIPQKSIHEPFQFSLASEEIPIKFQNALSCVTASFIEIWRVWRTMILILIANTGRIGANISQMMLFALSSHNVSPIFIPHFPSNHTSFPKRANTIPSGIKAITHRKITILIIRTTASATSGIKSAILTRLLSKKSINPPTNQLVLFASI